MAIFARSPVNAALSSSDRQPSQIPTWLIALILTATGIITHLLPHEMGVSTLGVLAMLSAAYLPPTLRLVPILMTLLTSDWLAGGYALEAMLWVYAGHVLATILLPRVLSRIGMDTVALAAVINAVAFYLVSNVSQMVLGFYPASAAGWWACYVMGLPFLAKGIMANLAFGAVTFGVIHLWRFKYANRFATAERD